MQTQTLPSSLNERLFNINRAVAEVHRCQDAMPGMGHPDALGCALGELDWIAELHRLLHERTE